MSPVDEGTAGAPTVVVTGDRPGPGRGDRIAGWLLFPLLVTFIVLFMTFVVFFDVVSVDGPSMLPTLRTGDRVLITKNYKVPVRGDIVVFTEPGPDGAPIDIIKRVVGVPGDTVEISSGRAIVNGSPEAPHTGIFTDAGSSGQIGIPAGTIYVLGDDRPESLDSRVRGPIPLSQVKGRAVCIILPPLRIRGLP